MHEVDFACKNESCQDDDPIFVNYWDVINRKRPTVTKGPMPGKFAFFMPKMPSSVFCRTCHTETSTRLCRTCHSVLPKSISDYEDIIIAVIGAKASGKSHYIGVLINEIIQTVGIAYSSVLMPENEETLNRYKTKFRDPLYKNKRTLDVTQSAQADPSVKRPLLYTMKFQVGSKINVVTLSLFDTAGEDLKTQQDMEKHTRYLLHSSGIICLLDPLQISLVREQLQQIDPTITLPIEDPNAEANDIVVRTTNLIRQELVLKEASKINIPLAISFSKTDAIKPLIDPTSSLLRSGLHTQSNTFDVNDFETVNNEMRSLVHAWTYGNIPSVLQLNYKDYAFFGVSSLGHAPKGKIETIQPNRVVDPFLWLLWKNGVIKGRE